MAAEEQHEDTPKLPSEEKVGNSLQTSELSQQPPRKEERSPELVKLHHELEEERKKSQELSRRMLYLQSDIVNLQRQSERRIAESKEETRLRFIGELVSVKEDLERAVAIAKASNSDSLFDGLRMMLSRIDAALRAENVQRINVSPGSNFDLRLHEAVAYSEGNGQEDGTVVSIVSNGYTVGGKVIRPALVEVARKNRAPPEQARTGEEKEKDEENQKDSTESKVGDLGHLSPNGDNMKEEEEEGK